LTVGNLLTAQGLFWFAKILLITNLRQHGKINSIEDVTSQRARLLNQKKV
jgi:hypothetical protein